MLRELTVLVLLRNSYTRTRQRTPVVKFIIFNKNYKETWKGWRGLPDAESREARHTALSLSLSLLLSPLSPSSPRCPSPIYCWVDVRNSTSCLEPSKYSGKYMYQLLLTLTKSTAAQVWPWLRTIYPPNCDYSPKQH